MSKKQARLHSGATLSTIRRLRGEKQDTLPKKTIVSEGFLANLETGRRQPSADVLVSLAEALEVPVDALGTVLGAGEQFCPCCDGAGTVKQVAA